MDETTANIITAVLDFLGKLAWPAVLLFLIAKFKDQIGGLLIRLGSLKVAGSEWVFQASSPKAIESSKTFNQQELEVGPDGFLTERGICRVITESGLLRNDEAVAGDLLIFQTPNQRMWLVATVKRIFIVLDDDQTRREAKLIQTFFDRSGALPLEFQREEGAGLVRFHADTWWFYSFHLFPTTSSLREAVEKLVKSAA